MQGLVFDGRLLRCFSCQRDDSTKRSAHLSETLSLRAGMLIHVEASINLDHY
jgi:hypothetical protein